jgi:alcohol dehydrogenase class IV
MNIRALSARQPGSPALRRYDEVATILTGSSAARAADGVRWVQNASRDLQIPPLRAYGVEAKHVANLVATTAIASSTKANPIVLTPEELTAILEAAL